MVDRAREMLDLDAAVVDVVLAQDRPAHPRQQVGERVAEHGAAAVADVHRPVRVGRAVLDVDRPPLAEIGGAVARAGLQGDPDLAAPEVVGQAQVDEAGLGDLDRLDPRQVQKARRERLGDRERRAPRLLGQHERGVGRGIAVRRIARRLDGDPIGREVLRQLARRLAGGDRGQHVVLQVLERVHCARLVRLNRRSCSSSA